MKFTLNPHQELAIDMLRRSLASGHKRPMLQAPTGAGKTILSAAIVEGALRKGNPVLFVVPFLSLVDQTVEKFSEQGISSVGVMQGYHPQTDGEQPVQVASVQTLMRRSLPDAGIVLIDEAHRWFDFYGKWMAMADWEKIPFVGLSATPWTKGLGKHYDDLLVPTTTKELIAKGFLSPFRVYAPSHPDLSKVKTVAGDYHEGQLSETMSQPVLIADTVSTWLKLGEDRPTLCFAVDRAHARKLAHQFEAAGVPTGYVDMDTPRDERQLIGERLRNGQIKVVCNVFTLTTGIDWDIRCIILARPTKSEMLFVQIVGRGLRTAEGKADCLLRDTLVLTDRGEVKIQDLTRDHRVWDGVNFVNHGGAVCRGVRPVISHDGITGTPDHKVMTNEGWMSLSEAHRRCVRIARTGFGWQPLRLTDNNFAEDRRIELQSPRRSSMRPLRERAYGSLSQHQEETRNECLPALQWAAAGQGAAVAVRSLSSAEAEVHQSQESSLSGLWRSRDRVSIFGAKRSRSVDSRQSRHTGGSINADRSHRQSWPLRAGQSSLGDALGKHEQSAPEEGEVWDILNAGPRQRFTANGRLVHNCLVLDHSDTTLRLGFVDDIHHEELDDGRHHKSKSKPRERQIPLPKECPKCSHLKPAGIHKCPACGFAPERQSAIEQQDGDLVQLNGRRKTKGEVTPHSKQEVWSMLLWYQEAKGKSSKFAKANYFDRYKEWPRGLHDRPQPADAAFLNWMKSKQIAWAKRMEKRQRQEATGALL